MIFENLQESAEANELILIDGGFCRFHLRKDKQLTIYEIIVLPKLRGSGIGSSMLDTLKTKAAESIFAKCPTDLKSNEWYAAKGFVLEGVEKTRTGRELNLWRMRLK